MRKEKQKEPVRLKLKGKRVLVVQLRKRNDEF